jgi:hypothetical protein
MLEAQFEDLRVIRGYLNSSNPNRTILRHTRSGRDVFAVPSARFDKTLYSVFVDQDGSWECACNDFRARGTPCKHIIEVFYRFFPEFAPSAPTGEQLAAFFREEQKIWYADARRSPHIPEKYEHGPAESTRDDHALEEKDPRLEELLVDLAQVMNSRWPLPIKRNRPTLPWGDRVLVRVMRLQHRKSIRSSKPMGERLEREGKVQFYPCRGVQSKYYSQEATLEKLREGFILTAAPYIRKEKYIIIDSSGVSPFYVSCWLASEYGTKNIRAGTKWFKVHIAIGFKSKAILGFIVTPHSGSETSDVVNFKPLVDGLFAHGFRPAFVIADNAYLTAENIAAAQAIGATLVGPLKPRNFHRDKRPSEKIIPIIRSREADPELHDYLLRARSVVEGVFSVEVRWYRNISSIGTKDEREAARLGEDILFVSRKCEFWARAIRYNLSTTVHREHRWNQRIWYSRGSVFSYLPLTDPGDDAVYPKEA